jgi:hypothetical protein
MFRIISVAKDNSVDYYLSVDPNQNALTSYLRNKQGKFCLNELANVLVLTICDDCEIAVDVASIF